MPHLEQPPAPPHFAHIPIVTCYLFYILRWYSYICHKSSLNTGCTPDKSLGGNRLLGGGHSVGARGCVTWTLGPSLETLLDTLPTAGQGDAQLPHDDPWQLGRGPTEPRRSSLPLGWTLALQAACRCALPHSVPTLSS